MLNSISSLGKTRPEQKWSIGTEFSGYSDFPEILGQPHEVHPKFWNEILENVFSIRSQTQNFRNFWSNGKCPRTLLPTLARLLKPKLPKPRQGSCYKEKRETSTLLQQRGQRTKRAQTWRYSKNEARSKRSIEAVEGNNMSPGSCAKIL